MHMETETSTILVVDDVRSAREAIAQRVAQEGHRVKTAENGHEALDLLAKEPFDLVLLDMMMPDMDGYEVLERIKSDDELRDIPVIMISGRDKMDSVIRCISAGAEDYLPKTVGLVLLRARINSSLEKKRWRDWQRKHVDRVVDSMAEIEHGVLATRLEASGDDIYAKLYRGFNQMADGLEDAARILEVARDLSDEMHLEVLFERIISATTQLLDADRGTLYIHDRKTGELWSLVAEVSAVSTYGTN